MDSITIVLLAFFASIVASMSVAFVFIKKSKKSENDDEENTAQVSLLKEQIGKLENKKDELFKLLDEEKQKSSNKDVTLAKLEKDIAMLENVTNEEKMKAIDALEKYNETSKELEEKTKNLLKAESELTSMKNELKQLEETFKREKSLLEDHIEILENEKEKLNRKIDEKESTIDKLTKEKFDDAEKIAHNEAKLRSLQINNNEMKEQYENKISDLNREIESLKSKNETNTKENSNLKEQIASMQAQLEAQKESNERLKEEFEEQSKKLEHSLDKIMRQHIEEKLKKLDETSIKNLDGVLKPLKDNLETFRKKVEESQEYSTKKFAELSKEIEQIVKAGMNISEEAKNLANALKGKKQMQGRWGELVLESILETSGLLKGQHYETQESFQDESGKIKRPDVVVKLPGNKSIIIDSKVSLNNYDSFVRAEIDEERENCAKILANDFKNHVDTLAGKDYAHYKSSTLQYVFMFVPIEGAFLVAMQSNPSLYEYALKKNIVIVNPSTLIVTLRTIYLYWQSVKSNTQAVKLFEEAGKLYDKIASFANTFKTLGNQIDTVSKTYSKALGQLSEGKGNILNRTENLKRLGAHTTKSLKDLKIDYQDLDLNDVEAEIIDENIQALEQKEYK